MSTQLVTEKETEYTLQLKGKKLTSPEVVAKLSNDIFKMDRLTTEMFLMVSCNSRLEPVSAHIMGIGSEVETITPKANILRTALLTGQLFFFLIHNHPSGDCNPSGNDKKTVNDLIKAFKTIGLKVTDSLIVSRNDMFSFKENGLL